MAIVKSIPIRNATSPGATIPAIGLGTWQSPPGQVKDAVEYALKVAGYRHIDAAWIYGNEKEVGEGIKASGVPRSEIFLTSKIWSTYMDRVEENFNDILKNLGTEYLDLLLLHWPMALNPNGAGDDPNIPRNAQGKPDVIPDWDLRKTWKQMEQVLASGKVKYIGVSNFSELRLKEILETATIKPAVDQLEVHPYNPQHKLLAYLKSEGIVAEAYSPLGSTNSTLLKDEVVLEIAKQHGVEPAQVLLGWLNAKDIVALPKSVTPGRITTNGRPTELGVDDIKKLDALAEGGKQRRFIRPAWGIRLGFEDWDWAVNETQP